jgi:signal transduction histidine kinase
MAIRDPELAGWLLDSLSSGLVAIDATGAVTALNISAQRILGTPPGRLEGWLGRDFREALASRPQVIALLEDALDGRERPSRAELILGEHARSPAATIGFTLLSVRDAAGAVRGAAIQFRDLSAFERRDEQARLRDRLAALGEMAAGLAHELRNPLSGMEVMAGLLKRRLAEGSQEHSLVLDLLAQLRVMARALDDALEFVRPVAPAPHPVDPVTLLELCVDRACARVAFPGKIERAYAEGVPRVAADPNQLLVAVTDLVVNALEAMAGCDDGRELRLELAVGRSLPAGPEPRAHHEVVLSIGDTGPGVPADLRNRIFYPFFSTKDGGSGVGLAKAQKVVTSHGGTIELESEPGRGATFRVRLPAAGEPS